MPEAAKRRKMAPPVRCPTSTDITVGDGGPEINKKESLDQNTENSTSSSIRDSPKGSETPTDRLSPDASIPEPPQKMAHYEASQSQKILQCLQNGKYSDINIKVNGDIIPAHKCILMASSPFFAEKLHNYDSNEVELNECPAGAVKELIDYLYTSRLNITQDGARDLLSVSCRLELASAKNAVELFLKMRMTTPLAIQTLKKQKNVSSENLLDVARNHAANYFGEIAENPDFISLPIDELEVLIQKTNLNVENEEQVYNAVLKWFKEKENFKNYSDQLFRLLQHVRLPLAKPQFLFDIVQAEPLIKQNSECEKLVDEAMRYHVLADQRPLMQSPRTQPRKTCSKRRLKEHVVLIGGLNRDKQQMQECFYFRPPAVVPTNPNAPQESFICRPEKLESPQIIQTTYCVAKVNNLAVLTGGLARAATDEVHAFIPSLDVWQQMAPMGQARFLHSSAALDGYLYVAGGMVNAKTRLNSVERWCPNTNKWEDVCPLPRHLSSCCLVSCDGRLYVIGGVTDGSKTVSDMHSYCPATNTWTSCKPLPEPERGVAAVALSSQIYVIGDNQRVFRYDTETGEWIRLKETNGGHLHGAATVFKGRIYVAGGLHCSDFINRTVEVYDQHKDTWSNVAILPTPVYAHGLITLTIES